MAPDDIRQFFTGEMTALLRLATHLTADTEKAETCLILTMRDCFESGAVSKERLSRWVRRIVVRNAIRLVLGIEPEIHDQSESIFCLPASYDLRNSLRDSAAILRLDDFDRLAFVICVFERCSPLDCALFLGSQLNDVKAAIVRARNQVLAREGKDQVNAGALSPDTAGALCDE
jgi:DNA-directed RNA polymerase specialized sigma24 family protein